MLLEDQLVEPNENAGTLSKEEIWERKFSYHALRVQQIAAKVEYIRLLRVYSASGLARIIALCLPKGIFFITLSANYQGPMVKFALF